MVNRLHIVNNDSQDKARSNKKNELSIGLQEYISELLVDPIEKKKSSLLKTIETVNSSSESVTLSYDRSLQYGDKLSEEKKLTTNNDPKKELASHKLFTEENLESIENKNVLAKVYSEPDPRLEKVSKLLEKIATLPLHQNTVETEIQVANEVKVEIEIEIEDKQDVKTDLDEEQEQKQKALIQTTNESSFVQRANKSLRGSLDDNFQTLIFEVNNLPLAVPLIKLGGIINIAKQNITPLVGTPDWFLGLVPNERGNLMVVDTQKFLMPERPVKDDRTYDYLIVLDNSQWALACHSVGDAKKMLASDIRWSSKSSKRPWFAGMVVEYMSALIEVDGLINQLAEQIVD